MNEKKALSSDQLQAKLKSLQGSADQQGTAGARRGDVEITVASRREAFDLKACRALLEENGISSKLVGRGFNQFVVVSRDDSSRAIDMIAANRETLRRSNPLTAGDYVVGIIAWSLGCGLGLPCIGLFFLYRYEASDGFMVVAIRNIFFGSVLLGGFLGYLRCRAIASRRRK